MSPLPVGKKRNLLVRGVKKEVENVVLMFTDNSFSPLLDDITKYLGHFLASIVSLPDK